ncbi:MAG TPA: nitroreductase family protein [Acidimicrobiia bacterium]|nr:nitroreductase family protein [Acidimicrobiia bacterium]
MEFSEVVARRRMVRAFHDRPVDPAVVDRLLDLARRAPSAGFTQGTEFLVLEGPDQTAAYWDTTLPIERRATFPWPRLLDAPVLILPMSSRDAYLDRYAEPDKGWTDRDPKRWPVPYWHVDAGFAVQTLLLAAVDAGLGALFFGIFEGLPALREAFGIPEHFTPVGTVALGYAADDDRPSASLKRGRRAFDEVVHRGRW